MKPAPQEWNPYVGPRPFEQQDSGVFFGRDREINEVLSLAIAHRVILLYAQSGAGKTSLLNAGLIPRLKDEGFEVLPIARVQGLLPKHIEMESITNIYIFNTLMSLVGEAAADEHLVQRSLPDFLKARQTEADESGPPQLLIFDQFEELFSSYPARWQDREGFFQQVSAALERDPLTRLIFVMREDYIAQLDPYVSRLPGKLQIRYRLQRLREAAAQMAITKPLDGTNRFFAEGVAQQLAKELLKIRVETTDQTITVPGEYVEPVQLQIVCQNLWRGLPPHVEAITHDHLKTFGDVNQALSEFYEQCIATAVHNSPVRERTLRDWFQDTLITPTGTRGTVYRGREKTGEVPNETVDILEDLHLVRAEYRAGARWYELTHDRFIGPIQKSNEIWRLSRRTRSLVLAGILLALIGLLVASATFFVANRAAETVQQSQETATASSANLDEFSTSLSRSRARPLRPGFSVSSENSTAGTIGAFVRDAEGQVYLITQQLDPVSSEAFVQPGVADGGTVPNDVVGDGVPFGDDSSDKITLLSQADLVGLVRLEKDITFEPSIPGIGEIQGVHPASLSMTVRKLGRTTGLTTGTITLLNAIVNVSIGEGESVQLEGVIITTPMSQGGDSGALVVDEEGYAIGIIVAGSNQSTIIAPIQDILDVFEVELCTSANNCPQD